MADTPAAAPAPAPAFPVLTLPRCKVERFYVSEKTHAAYADLLSPGADEFTPNKLTVTIPGVHNGNQNAVKALKAAADAGSLVSIRAVFGSQVYESASKDGKYNFKRNTITLERVEVSAIS